MSAKNFESIANSKFSSSGANDIFANFQSNNKKNTGGMNEEYTFRKIPVANIKLNPNNKNYNKNDTDADIEDLAARIDLEGLLSPLIVYQAGRNEYILLAGERRFKAISTKLRWKEVECKVYTKISESLKIFILNETNLGRPLTDEQRFIGYQEIVTVLEDSNEYDREKVAKLCNLSKYKMRQFETIRQNTEETDIVRLQSGEITFKDIKEIAEAKKQIAIARKKIEEASKIYAEAIVNPNIKFYIDRKNKYLFSVSQGKDGPDTFYGVKIHNYGLKQNNIVFKWATDSELPECNSQIEAQVHLDSYAINHNLEECSIEEFISKSQGEEKNKSKSKNDTPENETNEVPGTQENQNNYFPDIDVHKTDEEMLEHQGKTSTEKEETIIESGKDESQMDNGSDNHLDSSFNDVETKIDIEQFAFSENLIRENENNSDDVSTEDNIDEYSQLPIKDNKELEKYKNNYALSISFVGREVKSQKKVKGFLTYDVNTGKYFILPVVKIGKDLSTTEEAKNTIFGVGYEVDKESIYTEINQT